MVLSVEERVFLPTTFGSKQRLSKHTVEVQVVSSEVTVSLGVQCLLICLVDEQDTVIQRLKKR
jgi:hypothetical protein